jgi:hypothetical protein
MEGFRRARFAQPTETTGVARADALRHALRPPHSQIGAFRARDHRVRPQDHDYYGIAGALYQALAPKALGVSGQRFGEGFSCGLHKIERLMSSWRVQQAI